MRRTVIATGLLLAGASIVRARTAITTIISPDEARALVRLVLRHEGATFMPPYCEIEHLDRSGKPFVSDYYSFGAHCDFPNTPARSTFGTFLVSPRTGEVLQFDRCEGYDLPELRKTKQHIARRTHATETQEQPYRAKTGCPAMATEAVH